MPVVVLIIVESTRCSF